MTQTGQPARLYDEAYRPQFHFSAQRGWINDPNGLVFYRGEYHLFFQHNPRGIDWGNMTWGHAVSRDLTHWEQLANAIEPDALGTIFSGSAVVDWHNTSGFGTGKEPPIVAIYTSAGGTSPESQGKPMVQSAAYSNDRGRTFTKYAGNPVLPHGSRDPKVVWHEPTKRWIMALYIDTNEYGLFASPNLKEWTQIQSIKMPGSDECPDFFPMRVEGEPGAMRWAFTGANGHYMVGRFDGHAFTPEVGPIVADHGANYYAVQTWSDIPASDGRRIQLAWMNGGAYPGMPFNQQMSFPCTLTQHREPEGLRLRRWPVREIEHMSRHEVRLRNAKLAAGTLPIAGTTDVLWDIDAELAVGADADVSLLCRGEAVRYNAAEQKLTCLGRSAALAPRDGKLRLRVLVDRASIEVFADAGRVSMTSCFVPPPEKRGLEIALHHGSAELVSLKVHELRSTWR